MEAGASNVEVVKVALANWIRRRVSNEQVLVVAAPPAHPHLGVAARRSL